MDQSHYLPGLEDFFSKAGQKKKGVKRAELILRVLTAMRRERRVHPVTVYALCFALIEQPLTLPQVSALLLASDSAMRFAAAVAHRAGLIRVDGREVSLARGGAAYRWGLTAEGEQLVVDVSREVYRGEK